MIFKILFSVLILLERKLQCTSGYPTSTTSIPITQTSSPETLDLSNLGMPREHFFLKLQHTTNMREVQSLILRGNKFDAFLDCSTKLDSLKFLDLSYNNLRRFFFLCNKEYNLESLNVSHNHIEYINNQALNHRVMKLKILDVSYNDLYIVNDTMLEHMKDLEFLSLASNPIGENIDEFVFQNLTKLKHLNLRNISSPYFSPLLFEPLINLEYIDLSENPIEDMPTLPTTIKVLYACGTNIIRINELIMPQLRVLEMNYSPNLTSILFNNFENLTQLEVLSFNKSPRLSQVSLYKRMNSNLLPKLKRLSLQQCAIESLNADMASLIQKTKVIELQDNPWNCDCRLKWLSAMNLSNDTKRNFRCQEPTKHKGKLLHDVAYQQLECEESLMLNQSLGRILFSILWISILLFVLGTMATAFVYYTRGQMGQWLIKIRHRGSDTVSYTNVVESNNDLIRILPVGEHIV